MPWPGAHLNQNNMHSKADRLIRLIKLYFSRNPVYLILFVTGRCNADCKMCFKWEDRPNPKNELSLAEIDKISSKFGDVLQLTLSGGEPFLRDDIPEIAENFYRNNGARFITIPTNASFPERIESNVNEILKRCPHALLNIGLSLDGIGDAHDALRGLNGSFDKVLDTYTRLKIIRKKHNNLCLKVTTVLSSFNSEKIDEVLRFVKENMDIDSHEIVLARGNTRFKEAKEVMPTSYERLIRIFSMNARENLRKRKYQFSSLFCGIYEQMNKLIVETIRKKMMLLPCLAGKRLIEIYEDGTVKPCEILHTLPLGINSSMGNLRDSDYDINKILRSNKSQEILRHIKKSRCFCTFECALLTNIIFNPRAYPGLIRNILTA
jgi:Fe-coproporphyrin III synthase